MRTIAAQSEFPEVEKVCPAPKHHRFGMSKLNPLAACPGFMSREGTNEAAEDGTRLHEIMEKIIGLVGMPKAPGKSTSAFDALSEVLGKEAVSEEEEFYLEFCCKQIDYWLIRNPQELLSEFKVSVLNPGGSELNFGTGDLLIFLSDESAVLLDWKFGWIPVPPAETNLQGKGYAVGVLQKYPRLKRLGVMFVQPKLHEVTLAMFERKEIPAMYAEIKSVITAASAENKTLRPCQYCDFCGVAATCKALLNEASRAVSIHERLPMPQSFVGLQIQTPEEAVRALYVLDRLQVLIEESGLKEKAKEMARQSNGVLRARISDTEEIVVEMKQRNSPRSANSPALIADALKDVLSPEQVLSACDPKITRLEEVFADVLVEKAEAEAVAFLLTAEERAIQEPQRAKEIRSAAKDRAKETRITKKRAKEILNDVLTSEGLLSAPDAKVEYLKLRIEKQPKQITP